MNSLSDKRDFKSNDLGDQRDLVAHEMGHLMGLDDKEKGIYYPGDGGIMDYQFSNDRGNINMNPISENDVRTILKYANDYLNGNVDKNNPSTPHVTEIKASPEKATEGNNTTESPGNTTKSSEK